MTINSLPSSKKRKTSRNDKNNSDSTLQTIADLEKSVSDALETNASLNPLADLLHIASSTTDADVSLKAIFALYRLFTLIVKKGLLAPLGDEDPGRKAVRSWVTARLDAFAELLCQLLQDEEKTLRTSALRILFSLLRQRSVISSDTPSSSDSASLPFDVPFFQRVVRALLLCPSPACTLRRKQPKHAKLPRATGNEIEVDVRDLLLDTWLNVYADLRWFFLRETATILENASLVASHHYLPANALSILEKLSGIPSLSDSKFTFPKEQFWIDALNSKPKPRKKGKRSGDRSESESESDLDETDEDGGDWRKFFEDPKPDTSKKSGGTSGRRLYTLPIHAQLHTPAAHRAVFTRAWLALLPLLSRGGGVFSSGIVEEDDQEGLGLVARALVVLHQNVLPYLTRAVLIMDWVGSCVDHGGYVGLLALNALFVLMREYNLDYPSFYTRLYAFLDRSVLHTKHRARFFRLTELFLSSSHLPATLLASFAKRLARLSLSAPPAGVIIVIPFVYNILKRHPALMCMIHRVEASSDGDEDPFDENEPNPTLTNALNSSLWELAAHKQHYHAPAATLVRVFEEPFTRPGFTMEDFLDHTYATLFETEANRRLKKEPALLDDELERMRPMVIRSGDEQQDDTPIQTDAVSAMWVFG